MKVEYLYSFSPVGITLESQIELSAVLSALTFGMPQMEISIFGRSKLIVVADLIKKLEERI